VELWLTTDFFSALLAGSLRGGCHEFSGITCDDGRDVTLAHSFFGGRVLRCHEYITDALWVSKSRLRLSPNPWRRGSDPTRDWALNYTKRHKSLRRVRAGYPYPAFLEEEAKCAHLRADDCPCFKAPGSRQLVRAPQGPGSTRAGAGKGGYLSGGFMLIWSRTRPSCVPTSSW
jgi:hypothetical protein